MVDSEGELTVPTRFYNKKETPVTPVAGLFLFQWGVYVLGSWTARGDCKTLKNLLREDVNHICRKDKPRSTSQISASSYD